MCLFKMALIVSHPIIPLIFLSPFGLAVYSQRKLNFLSVNTHQLFFNNTTLILQIYAHQKGTEIFNLKSTHLFMKPQSITNSNGLGIPPVSVSSWYRYWNKIANLWIVIQNLSQIIRINLKISLLKMKIFKKLFG